MYFWIASITIFNGTTQSIACNTISTFILNGSKSRPCHCRPLPANDRLGPTLRSSICLLFINNVVCTRAYLKPQILPTFLQRTPFLYAFLDIFCHEISQLCSRNHTCDTTQCRRFLFFEVGEHAIPPFLETLFFNLFDRYSNWAPIPCWDFLTCTACRHHLAPFIRVLPALYHNVVCF